LTRLEICHGHGHQKHLHPADGTNNNIHLTKKGAVMDNLNNTNQNNIVPTQPPFPVKAKKAKTISEEIADIKRFFNLTGGSFIYCISAAFIAYGIVKIMGPILAQGDSLLKALPCIITLHVYELAMLGALLLVVFKKVVDDAVSLVILIALLLIGTSITQGSVADTNINLALLLAVAAFLLALIKICMMRRYTKIPFKLLSIIGISLFVVCNYFAPILLAKAIAVNPTQETARRELWMLVWLIILFGAVLVIMQAARTSKVQKEGSSAFLQSPPMVYLFALILLIATGIHQYSMAFTFTLERVFGDFLPLIAVVSLLFVELLRHSGKKFGPFDFIILLIPFAATMLAINEKSIIVSSKLSLALICYPPILLALTGLAVVTLAMYHKRSYLLFVSFIYLLGVILTAGFSPEDPYNLNTNACFATLVAGLLAYGLIRWNPYFCFASITIFSLGMCFWDKTTDIAAYCGITETGVVAGTFGLGVTALCLLFGKKMHKVFRVLGIICLAGFMLDYLPNSWHWNYLFALIATILITIGFWFRTKDRFIVSILLIPFMIRLYILSKQLAYWRVVILGFLLLGLGIMASLFKSKKSR
jgi:hypothetical protein